MTTKRSAEWTSHLVDRQARHTRAGDMRTVALSCLFVWACMAAFWRFFVAG